MIVESLQSKRTNVCDNKRFSDLITDKVLRINKIEYNKLEYISLVLLSQEKEWKECHI